MHQYKQQFQQQLTGPWPARVTSAILLVLIALWIANNLLAMFDVKKNPEEPAIVTQPTQVQKKSSLAGLDLFGAVEKARNSNVKETAKPTKLNLTLRGILATDDPKQGIAQIQNAKKEENHFAVNDSVFGMATLVEIYADKVILLHNDRRETLLLPEEFLNLKHFSVERQKQSRKETVTNYRDIFLNGDGIKILKLFGFDTAYKHGEFFGFKIKALGPEGVEMLDILGVQDGDVIVVVNDLRFSETLEAAQQLKDLKHATSVDAIIDRDGVEIPFHFEFDTPIADKIDTGNAGSAGTQSVGYQNKITEDGKVDRSGFTQSLIDSRDGDDEDDEDLGPDWNETAEAEEYRQQQLQRRTGVAAPVEMDH